MFERRFGFVDKWRRLALLRDAVEEKSEGEDGGKGMVRPGGLDVMARTTAVGCRRHSGRAANLPARPRSEPASPRRLPQLPTSSTSVRPADVFNERHRPPGPHGSIPVHHLGARSAAGRVHEPRSACLRLPPLHATGAAGVGRS